MAVLLQIDPQAKALRRDGDKSSKASMPIKGVGVGDDHHQQKRKTEYLVKVHFDGFTSKWDESYGEQEWREKKLQPLYSKVRYSWSTRLFERLLVAETSTSTDQFTLVVILRTFCGLLCPSNLANPFPWKARRGVRTCPLVAWRACLRLPQPHPRHGRNRLMFHVASGS